MKFCTCESFPLYGTWEDRWVELTVLSTSSYVRTWEEQEVDAILSAVTVVTIQLVIVWCRRGMGGAIHSICYKRKVSQSLGLLPWSQGHREFLDSHMLWLWSHAGISTVRIGMTTSWVGCLLKVGILVRDYAYGMQMSPTSTIFPWPYHSHPHTLTPSNLTPLLTSSMMGASHCPASLGLFSSIPPHMSSNIQRGLPDPPLVLQWLQLYAKGIERHWAQFVPIWGQLYNVTVWGVCVWVSMFCVHMYSLHVCLYVYVCVNVK